MNEAAIATTRTYRVKGATFEQDLTTGDIQVTFGRDDRLGLPISAEDWMHLFAALQPLFSATCCIVPIEPTHTMLTAMAEAWEYNDGGLDVYRREWEAALSNAPKVRARIDETDNAKNEN